MANDAQMPELLQRARYMINNPSAWDSFDQGASDIIKALCSDLCASGHVRVSESLVVRCREIIEWHETAMLEGEALREMATDIAKRLHQDMGTALAMAEKNTLLEAARILAALTPAPQPEEQFAENAKKSVAHQQDMGDGRVLTSETPIPKPMTADQWRNSPARFATHGITAAPPAATPTAQEAVPFQNRVQPWMNACFGPEISADRLERGDRMLEEVFELLQSGGYPRDRVASLSSYVWSRPEGEPAQEVGGVMVTLAAYCLAHDLDMHEAGETELARVWTKVEKIRAKQAAKPFGSALPQEWPVAAHPPQPSETVAEAANHALDACRIIDAAVLEGHDNTSDLICHLLEAVEPARAALRAMKGE